MSPQTHLIELKHSMLKKYFKVSVTRENFFKLPHYIAENFMNFTSLNF